MSARLTGLVGHPISHSKSPVIHEYWLEQNGISGSYKLFDLSCEELEQGLKQMVADGCRGFNVTVPHKVSVMELCDEVDDLARVVGAVNTVSIQDGKMTGTNTDVFGFTQNIKDNAPDFDFTKGSALVLGAGGAARAVVQGLLQEGVPEILLSNRTASKADSLIELASDTSRIKRVDWEKRSDASVLNGLNLLVNTTALGMSGKPALEIDLSELGSACLVHDIVYAPLQTELLVQAAQRGNPIVTGIGMLLHQARPAFELWHGVLPEVTQELIDKVCA